MKPLNPKLYKALERTLGRVEITGDGLQASVYHRPDYGRKGKLSVVVSGGEYYRVNCPFCHNIRKRLHFNHLWGETDEKTGDQILYVVHCFNEQCIDSREIQLKLFDRVYTSGVFWSKSSGESIESHDRRTSGGAYTAELPANCVPINSRRASEVARMFLEYRNFDLDELSSKWQITYCEKSDDPRPRIHERIVIPVFRPRRRLSSKAHKTALAGWQARALNTGGKAPKYLSSRGMKKSQLLYGLPEAIATTGPVVICEGPTDVWRLGTNAVAMFGKSLSANQNLLLTSHFTGRPIVLFLDSDAQDDSLKAQRALRAAKSAAGDKSGVLMAELPTGRQDVGDCTHDEAWGCVSEAMGKSMRELGVQLPS